MIFPYNFSRGCRQHKTAILTNVHKRADVAHKYSQSMRKPTLMHLHLHLWARGSFVRQLDELYVKLSCSVLMYSLFLSCTLSLQDCVMVAEADQHQGQRHSSGPWTAPDWDSVQQGAVGGWMMRSRWVSTPCCPANPQGNDTTIGGTHVTVWASKVRRSCRVLFLFLFFSFFRTAWLSRLLCRTLRWMSQPAYSSSQRPDEKDGTIQGEIWGFLKPEGG